VSSLDAAPSSHEPKVLIRVVNEGAGTFQVLERSAAPESASSEPCVVYHVTPFRSPSSKAGFDDFDNLASEVAGDAKVAAEVARGRQWVAGTIGNGDLASLRLAAGLSQSELARLCDIEQPHVSRYESGRHEPLVSTASRMAKALGVTLEVFAHACGLSRAKNDQVQL